VHNRIRSRCKECLGTSICPHKRQKGQCKECGGSQICEHNRIRSKCKECRCPHKRHKDRCQECKQSPAPSKRDEKQPKGPTETPATEVQQKPARSRSPQKMNTLGGGPYKTAATTGGAKRKRGDGDDAGQEELSKREGKRPMEPMGALAAGMRQEHARSRSPQKGIALGGGPYKTTAATKRTAKQRTRGGGNADLHPPVRM